MTTPTGLLEWGQSGNYNGIDDRAVITALSQGRLPGLVGPPPTLAAQSGLTIAIGPWLALVNCGDGTRAVVGSRTTQTINETAGGGSSRTDVIWADINVDGATWTAAIVASPVSPTRTGVALGTITVPAGAATAAAMTFTPAVTATSGSYATFDSVQKIVTQQSFTDLTGVLTIPAGEPCVGDRYEIELMGHGQWPVTTAQSLTIQAILGSNQLSGASLVYDPGYFRQGNTFRFRWVARLLVVSVGPSGSVVNEMTGELTGQGSLLVQAGNNQNTSGATQIDFGGQSCDTTAAQTFKVQAKWGGANGTITKDAAYYRRIGVGIG
jgi:hypothetical protein